MSEIYSHWSDKPLTIDRNYSYKDRNNFKPTGLWFDLDGDWWRWCSGEDFNLDRFKYRNILTLDESRLLRLQHSRDIDRFTEKYAKPNPKLSFLIEIQWQQLKDSYMGIVIAPYCWERRMSEHTFWYYSWDCASGCIWDLSAVLSVESVKVESSVLMELLKGD